MFDKEEKDRTLIVKITRISSKDFIDVLSNDL